MGESVNGAVALVVVGAYNVNAASCVSVCVCGECEICKRMACPC